MKQQLVFARVESKYLVCMKQVETLEKLLESHMLKDRYWNSHVNSVYFDTSDWFLVRNSIEKPAYKEKMRLRCYGTPNENSKVFLEIKKKLKGTVYKRRDEFTMSEAVCFMETGKLPLRDDQIMSELRWFCSRYNPSPKACIFYDRIALVGQEDPDLRITFDFNISGKGCEDGVSSEVWSRQDSVSLLSGNMSVMEIKSNGATPLWLCRELNRLCIYPASYSKYGTYYTNEIPENRRNEICLKVS